MESETLRHVLHKERRTTKQKEPEVTNWTQQHNPLNERDKQANDPATGRPEKESDAMAVDAPYPANRSSSPVACTVKRRGEQRETAVMWQQGGTSQRMQAGGEETPNPIEHLQESD